jgi:hypothetical protein
MPVKTGVALRPAGSGGCGMRRHDIGFDLARPVCYDPAPVSLVELKGRTDDAAWDRADRLDDWTFGRLP